MTYKTYIETYPPEVAANIMVCVVHQTNYLLDQQLRQLQAAFLKEGGITERIYKARQAARGRQFGPPNASDRSYRTNRTDRPNRTDTTKKPAPPQ